MADLAALKAFNLTEADLTVWVFKRSTREDVPVFTGRWIGITDKLDAALRSAVGNATEAITETISYDILAQNNESSALTLDTDETHIALIKAQASNPTPARKVNQLKQVSNADFYVLRFAAKDAVLLAIRKTNATWSTRRSTGVLRVVFEDAELDVDNRPSFSLQPVFDFFVLEPDIFVSNKNRFESVLTYRTAHAEAFADLTSEREFASIFSDLGPITSFVGTNKIQLRRAVAIREKGHYRDPDFMQNLRDQYEAMNLAIKFDARGRIIPTPESCRDIFKALLDHRLDSRLSRRLYDVPSTEPVG